MYSRYNQSAVKCCYCAVSFKLGSILSFNTPFNVPQGCCGDDGSLVEVDGTHPARTLGLTTAELKYQLQNKEEAPENLLLELEKLVLVT